MKTIYLATIKRDKVSGCDKYYVGQTSQEFKKRKKQHLDSAKNPRSRNAFYQAIRKYGEENVFWTILEQGDFTPEELDEKEIYYIDQYHSWIGWKDSKGYNMTKGGKNAEIQHSRIFQMKPVLDKVLFLNENGKNIKEIALETSLTPEVVYSILKGRSWGEYTKIPRVPPRDFNFSKDDVEKILFLSQTKDYKEIAKELNANSTQIWEIINGVSYTIYSGLTRNQNIKERTERAEKEEILNIVNLYNKGLTCKEIEEKTRFSLKFVYAIISGQSHSKLTGIKRKPKHKFYLDEEELDKIIQLKNEGKTATIIAEELQRSVAIIDRVLKRQTYREYTNFPLIENISQIKNEEAKEWIDKAFSLYDQGCSKKQIAKELNKNETSIGRVLNGKIYKEYTKKYFN